jgi:hypothetical protein
MKKHLLPVLCTFVITFFSCEKEDPLLVGPPSVNNTPITPGTPPIPSYPESFYSQAELIGNLSNAGADITGAVCLDKLFLASSDSNSLANIKTVVDVFDIKTKSRTSYPLSKNRKYITSVASDTKVFFAGGYNGEAISRVDIVDPVTNTWTTSELSIPRYNMAAVASGDKVYFAGGITSTGNPVTRVDIYDINANEWSTAELREARSNFAAAASGNKLFFCGGSTQYYRQSPTVDVYDELTKRWSGLFMPFPFGEVKALVLDKIVFVGGAPYTSSMGTVVSTYMDPQIGFEGGFSFQDIIGNLQLGVSNNKIMITGQRKSNTGIMHTINIAGDVLDQISLQNDLMGQAVISYNNYIYVAGGVINEGTKRISGVYKFIL